jgi:hypothetical protein
VQRVRNVRLPHPNVVECPLWRGVVKDKRQGLGLCTASHASALSSETGPFELGRLCAKQQAPTP